ncbi:MAG: CvpA family protein [Clostridia bacterium]|nr:CvpA family protein [Clostridia bacterium]MBQ9878905.1 CvpA family protein [Clostridia bacterium]
MGTMTDIILIIVILATALMGVKKGLIRTVLDLAAVAVSLFAAAKLAQLAAGYIYNSYVRDSVINAVVERIPAGAINSVSQVVSALPDTAQSLIKTFGFEIPEVALDANATASLIVTKYVEPFLLTGMNVMCAVLIFIILSFILKLIIKIADSGVKKTALKTPNLILGGVLGAAKGCVYAGVLASALMSVAALLPETNLSDAAAGSKICELVAKLIR